MQSRPVSGPWIERFVASRGVRAGYASMVAHLAALLLLALLMLPATTADHRPLQLSLSTRSEPPQDEAGITVAAGDPGSDAATDEPGAGGTAAATTAETPPAQVPTAPPADAPAPSQPDDLQTGDGPPDQRPPTEPAADAAGIDGEPPAQSDIAGAGDAARRGAGGDAPRGDPFAARRGAARGAGASARGGSAGSEAAVTRGLEWLARHQAADGSWRFDLSGCRCDGACRHRGTIASTTAATGIALLPFLGAGQTQAEGVHRETVTRGLYYLMSRMRATPRGGDLSEGTMYGHGVATLALAEALGMTGDRMLVPYVRDGVRFIETAQDLHGGGWRYLPGQPGDTTVTAWQLAALKSAALSGVAVPSPTLDGVCRFLDRVQVRDGEAYGYLGPRDGPCTSAIGLLCRVYTAWPDAATIDRGLARLAKPGPDREAVYRNFYLSQALLLRDHPAWPRWNRRNRDQLVARQDAVGHEAGSWFFTDADTAPGGRLGHTALAILTLEVYYRLLPIYTTDAAASRW